MNRLCILILLCLVTADVSLADSMSCGVRLVVVGDHKYDVRKKCGEPASAQKHYVAGPFQGRDQYGRRIVFNGIRVDTWVYDFGEHKFTRILRFEDDRLVRIDKTRR